MKIYVNHEIAIKMMLEFTSKMHNKPFKLVDLTPIDVYAFVLADTYFHVDECVHDTAVALNRAIERAERLGKDNFREYIEENKDLVITW